MNRKVHGTVPNAELSPTTISAETADARELNYQIDILSSTGRYI